MKTKEYDELVRFFHNEEGYGWKKAQEKADSLVKEERKL